MRIKRKSIRYQHLAIVQIHFLKMIYRKLDTVESQLEEHPFYMILQNLIKEFLFIKLRLKAIKEICLEYGKDQSNLRKMRI